MHQFVHPHDILHYDRFLLYFIFVLRREGDDVFRRALNVEIEGEGQNRNQKRTRRWQVGEEGMKDGLSREDTLCRSMWVVVVGGQIATRLLRINLASFTYFGHRRI